ncbi:hydrolase [Flavobacteriaceae bacterium R38]|nr:hydrolase [Flavobacteriaceae bacterium R38]
MKNRIFMYLFIFSVLYILFQYTNAKNYFKSTNNEIARKDEMIIKLKDSLAQQNIALEEQIINNLDLQYFALDGNDDASVYFDEFNIEDLSLYISDKLLETNEKKGNNPLVPYDGMSGGSMKINKIRVLNHKWIIADFSDGKYWGELFITYEMKEDKSVEFTMKEHLLYARSRY